MGHNNNNMGLHGNTNRNKGATLIITIKGYISIIGTTIRGYISIIGT